MQYSAAVERAGTFYLGLGAAMAAFAGLIGAAFETVFEDTFDGEVFAQIAYNQNKPSYPPVVREALTSGK